MGKYLIVNAGSSSLKFSLYEYEMSEAKEVVNGYIEKIGNKDSFYTLKYNQKKSEKSKVIMNHKEAVETMIEELLENQFLSSLEEIEGIGHRVLHGGEFYSESVLITEEVLDNIRSIIPLGPLHLPGEIDGIESMGACMPEDILQVAVFDTAFHQTIPRDNYMYALPYSWYEENKVRKYGFHGTSHKYITEQMQEYFGKKNVNLIICHLGSGASLSCIQAGKCVNTSMGLTPLDGLIMGTRCGSIDSSIIEYICKEKGLTVEEVTTILNKQSGLLGIAGENDFRDLQKMANDGDDRANLAIQMLKNSIVNYIAQYYFELGGDVDALIFTAGIGENNMGLREEIVNSISLATNVDIDKEANNNIARFKDNQRGIISTENSKFKVMVIPTDEEYMILKDTVDVCKPILEARERSNNSNKVYQKTQQ